MVFVENQLVRSRFVIQKSLGYGSYGNVFKVLDRHDNKEKAMKAIEFINNEEEAMNEVRCLGRLENVKSVPKVVSFFVLGNELCIVQQLFHVDFHHLSKSRTFSQGLVAKVAIRILRILEQIHTYGIIHRDIKLGNIMAGGELENIRVYLIDFGIGIRFRTPSGKRIIKTPAGDLDFASCEYSSLRLAKGLKCSESDDVEMLGYAMMELRRIRPFANATEDETIRMKEAFRNDPSTVLNGANKFLLAPITLMLHQRPDFSPNYQGIKDRFKECTNFSQASPLKLQRGTNGKWNLTH